MNLWWHTALSAAALIAALSVYIGDEQASWQQSSSETWMLVAGVFFAVFGNLT